EALSFVVTSARSELKYVGSHVTKWFDLASDCDSSMSHDEQIEPFLKPCDMEFEDSDKEKIEPSPTAAQFVIGGEYLEKFEPSLKPAGLEYKNRDKVKQIEPSPSHAQLGDSELYLEKLQKVKQLNLDALYKVAAAREPRVAAWRLREDVVMRVLHANPSEAGGVDKLEDIPPFPKLEALPGAMVEEGVAEAKCVKGPCEMLVESLSKEEFEELCPQEGITLEDFIRWTRKFERSQSSVDKLVK
ncbi:unnamed protein product, partial [Prorocentrum cordatum]